MPMQDGAANPQMQMWLHAQQPGYGDANRPCLRALGDAVYDRCCHWRTHEDIIVMADRPSAPQSQGPRRQQTALASDVMARLWLDHSLAAETLPIKMDTVCQA